VTARMKVTLAGIGTAAATGIWLGYTRAAFFLPGWTPQRARSYKPGGAA
jgi:hypothetical protein